MLKAGNDTQLLPTWNVVLNMMANSWFVHVYLAQKQKVFSYSKTSRQVRSMQLRLNEDYHALMGFSVRFAQSINTAFTVWFDAPNKNWGDVNNSMDMSVDVAMQRSVSNECDHCGFSVLILDFSLLSLGVFITVLCVLRISIVSAFFAFLLTVFFSYMFLPIVPLSSF